MKFQIRKASDGVVKPCGNAYRDVATSTNKQFTYEAWFVDINSLEALMELVAEVGSELIIDADNIKIYDDFVE